MATSLTEEFKEQFPEFDLILKSHRAIGRVYGESLHAMGYIKDFKLSSESGSMVEIVVNADELLTNRPIAWIQDVKEEK